MHAKETIALTNFMHAHRSTHHGSGFALTLFRSSVQCIESLPLPWRRCIRDKGKPNFRKLKTHTSSVWLSQVSSFWEARALTLHIERNHAQRELRMGE